VKVVIIIPTFNEFGNIQTLLEELNNQFSLMKHECHILVVDDNSPDGTAALVRVLKQRYDNLHLLTGEKNGLGAAYIRGMTYAMETLQADVLFEMDADFSHKPEDVPRLMAEIDAGADFVIGSRYVPGGTIPKEWAWHRKLNSWGGNAVARNVAGIYGVRDCTAGFRAMRTSLLRKINLSDLRVQGYAFQVALLHAVKAAGACIKEIPVEFVERADGESKLGLRDILEFIINAWWIRLHSSKTFIKFAIVGLSGVVVNLCFFTFFLGTGLNKYLASPIAIELSIVSNFLLNNYWTFRWRKTVDPTRIRGLKFNVVSLLSLVLSYGTFILLSSLFPDVPPQVHQFIGIIPATLVNYFLNSYWTFRQVDETRKQPDRTSKFNARIFPMASVEKMTTPAIKRLILISLAVLALLLAAQEGPLEGMHWDAPIYLYQAKRFAETHYFVNYARHTVEIVDQVRGNLPAGEEFSHAFWRFVRIGHIAVLGGVIGFFGSTLTAIVFATWLYTSFLITGIAFLFYSVLMLGKMREPELPWFTGAAISTLLFFLSDIYSYLAGNLVSEVLCVFLLSASILALLRSINTGRLPLAILSGLLVFASYTARVESVWTWLTFLVAYLIVWRGKHRSTPWKPFLATCLAAFGFYVAYAYIFYPLADPHHNLAYVSGLTTADPHNGVPAYRLIFVAGGLLWVGAMVCLRWLGQSELVCFGWVWLLLSTLPWIPQFILEGPSQTRMFALLIPPLFLLSSAGWSLLLHHDLRRSIKIAVLGSLCLALVSQPKVYAWLHDDIPGMWRVQLVHSFLAAPKYERNDYLPTEMATFSHAVYDAGKPTVLVSNPELSQGNLNLIRFFGPSYQADADLALAGDPTNKKLCNHKFPDLGEPVLFCQGYSDPASIRTHQALYRILFLSPTKMPAMPSDAHWLVTTNFTLEGLRN